MSNVIEIRPIDKKTWHGKTGEESFTRPKVIRAFVNSQTNMYNTGLSSEDIKKLEDKGVTYDLTPNFNPNKPHPFWDSKSGAVKLENKTQFFDINQSLPYIHYKIMKASKYVANSMEDYEKGKFPDATHVMYEEGEALKVKASKVQIKNKAIIEASKLSTERKISLLMIIEGIPARGKSDDFITTEIDKIIENDPAKFVDHITMDDEDLAIQALILECLQKSRLRKNGHKIMYHDSVLGQSVLDVVAYLREDENQELRIKLMGELNE